MDERTIPGQNATLPERRFPDFLGIGAQKAGTTWLHDNLRRHPDVWLPPVKELHYFDGLHMPSESNWTQVFRRNQGARALRGYLDRVDADDWDYGHIAALADIVAREPSDDWYGRLFAVAGRRACCGEITPRYSILPAGGVAHVKALMPNARIVFLIRDPIERCWSQIRMDISESKVARRRNPIKMAGNFEILQCADYPTIIENWSAYFPADRFLMLPFDDIAGSPEQVLLGICTFLGLDFRPEWFGNLKRPVHVGKPLEMPSEVYLILKDRLRSVYDRLMPMFPGIATQWFARHY